jgi:glycerophosphoryl diester phosphodiesterase
MSADWPYPFWIAHRGAGTLAPENTLAAFRVGASHGYRAFECDVKLSADGVPFLLHDATLRRTTPQRGRAGRRPWAELSRLDAGSWHSDAFRGEPLPSLESVAGFCLAHGFALNIEMKPTPGTDLETGRVIALEAARLWADAAVKPLLSAFRPNALAAARAAEPALPRALLIDALRPGWLRKAQALDCAAVVAQYALLDATIIARIHDTGMRALCYTVNDPAAADWLVRLGVDGLITDAVDVFSPLADVPAWG